MCIAWFVGVETLFDQFVRDGEAAERLFIDPTKRNLEADALGLGPTFARDIALQPPASGEERSVLAHTIEGEARDRLGWREAHAEISDWRLSYPNVVALHAVAVRYDECIRPPPRARRRATSFLYPHPLKPPSLSYRSLRIEIAPIEHKENHRNRKMPCSLSFER
jgi:hypothetical protein